MNNVEIFLLKWMAYDGFVVFEFLSVSSEWTSTIVIRSSIKSWMKYQSVVCVYIIYTLFTGHLLSQQLHRKWINWERTPMSYHMKIIVHNIFMNALSSAVPAFNSRIVLYSNEKCCLFFLSFVRIVKKRDTYLCFYGEESVFPWSAPHLWLFMLPFYLCWMYEWVCVWYVCMCVYQSTIYVHSTHHTQTWSVKFD